MDLLLLYPCFTNEIFSPLTLEWNLGAGYVIAALRARGVTAEQLVIRKGVTLSEVVDRILAKEPRIVGFTMYDVNFYFVRLIAAELKKRAANPAIIVGGPTPTFSDELILRSEPSVDVCVRGEGEETAFHLVQALVSRTSLEEVEGISFRRSGSFFEPRIVLR